MLQKLKGRLAGRGAETERPSAALVVLAAFFFALPLPLTVFVVRFGPGGFDPAAVPLFSAYAPAFAAAGLLLGFFSYLFTVGRRRVASLLVALGWSVVLLEAASILMGVAVHRDFFSPAFQYALSAPAVFLLALRSQRGSEISRGALRTLGRAGYVMAAFYAEWIILVGYAVVTRAEPRPIETLIYNAYNLPLVLVLFLASRGVERRAMRTLSIGAAGVEVDGKSIDAMLGERRAVLLAAFVAAPDRRLRCPDVQQALAARAHGGAARAAKTDCAACAASGMKATDCAEYRSAYNSLLDLKKLLEFLEIGSITAPDNRRLVLTEGWRLTLFENARIVLR